MTDNPVFSTLKNKINSSSMKQITANIGWLFFDKILRMGVGLFVGIWVARYLGPEQYGMLSYAGAFVSIFASIASLGLDGIAVREIVKDPNNKEEILGTTFLLKMMGGILSVGLIGITAVFITFDNVITKYIIFIIATGVIFQSFDTIDIGLQAELKSRYTVYVKSLAFIIAAIVKVILLLTEASLLAFAWVGLFETIIGAIGMIASSKFIGISLGRWRFCISRSKKLLIDSWPLIISGFAIIVYMRVDQIMIGHMLDSKAVGIYSVAVRLVEVWYFIPMCIASSVSPKFVELKKRDSVGYLDKLQLYYTLTTWLAITMAIGTYFIADWLISLLWGDKYLGASDILIINIWASIFVFQGVARSIWTRVENLQRYDFIFTVTGCIVNVGLNYILIPIYHGKGAAFATLISYATSVLLAPYFIKEMRISVKMLIHSYDLINNISKLIAKQKRS